MKRYSDWKHDPNRVKVASRDWRGRYVPDLKIKRIERALWLLLAGVIAFGLLVNWVLITNPHHIVKPVHIPT